MIDRPKGYFPVPALTPPGGAGARARGATRCARRAARERGLFDPGYVDDAARRARTTHRTTLDGSELWQLALLELWLQEQGL